MSLVTNYYLHEMVDFVVHPFDRSVLQLQHRNALFQRGQIHVQILKVFDRILLRKRVIIETFIDQLKNISQIEHSRQRNFNKFIVNVLCSVIAYCRKPIKPFLHRDKFLAFAS